MNTAIIRSIEDFEEYLNERMLTWKDIRLSPDMMKRKEFPLRFPRFYADLINWRDPEDPLRKLIIPTDNEAEVKDYELLDPIGDHTNEPVPGLIHRYPNRCLLLLTTHCTVHCRFCFRRDVIGTPMPIDLPGITTYLTTHKEITEIIFSGGDPATIPPAFLSSMIDKLSPISHIKTWRFHTRSMVVDPGVVTNSWLNQLDRLQTQQKIVVFHIDHAREITPELVSLVKTLQNHHVSVLSQSVLLKGVNDSPLVLSTLFETISANGIHPYYLHHLDKARGTHQFRLSIEEGKALYMKLRGKSAGYCIPEYVVDLPGGDGKVPVMWLRMVKKGTYEVENFEGKTITYIDPIGI